DLAGEGTRGNQCERGAEEGTPWYVGFGTHRQFSMAGRRQRDRLSFGRARAADGLSEIVFAPSFDNDSAERPRFPTDVVRRVQLIEVKSRVGDQLLPACEVSFDEPAQSFRRPSDELCAFAFEALLHIGLGQGPRDLG